MSPGRNLLFVSVIAAGQILSSSQAAAQYTVNANCTQCHQQRLQQEDFCKTIPALEWARDDKHNRAFFLLHETDPADPQKGAEKRALVRQILGFDLSDAFEDRYTRLKDAGDDETKQKVAEVKACLRCHGTWPKAAGERFSHSPPVPLELGVSCQACHGPGLQWATPHAELGWRRVTPAAKEALGCRDVRSPAAKARLCASCHVGNIAEDKFVKHEWYAGGHPPLPSFELASFEAQMPVHWTPLREKGAFRFRDEPMSDQERRLIADQNALLEQVGVPREGIKSSYRGANFPGTGAANELDPFIDLPRMKDAAVAGVVVLETYVKTIGEYAGQAAEQKVAWPELSLYDCTACHHELRSGLASTTRPHRNHTPGRPPLATWPLALTQLAVAQAAGYDGAAMDMRWSSLRGQIQQLERAATSRPFGDPAAMKTAAGALATTLDQLATDAANTRFDEHAATSAIELLTNAHAIETNDFYTARQAAWAIREIAKDLGSSGADQLFSAGGADPLALTLPSGQQRSVMDNLRRWLPAAAKYDAARFREELKAARTKLGIQ